MGLGLNEKIAVIPVGNTGLGAAAAEGASLFPTARNKDDLKAVSDKITKYHCVDVDYITAEVTEEDAGDRIIAAAFERFGQVDVLVNAAGATRGGIFWEIDD